MRNVRDVRACNPRAVKNAVIRLRSYGSYVLLLCESKTIFVDITPLQTIYYNSYVVFTLSIFKYVCRGVVIWAVSRKTSWLVVA